jgi:hypothetical protein
MYPFYDDKWESHKDSDHEQKFNTMIGYLIYQNLSNFKKTNIGHLYLSVFIFNSLFARH